MHMKKLLVLGVLFFTLTSCEDISVPNDSNIYVVESAELKENQMVFSLRDVDDDLIVPLDNCVDGYTYEKGEPILVNNDLIVTKIDSNQHRLVDSLLLVFLSVVATLLITRYSSNKH